MRDSLSQQIAAGAGIPDLGTRLAILVVALFALAVTGLLLYFKMTEADKNIGGD